MNLLEALAARRVPVHRSFSDPNEISVCCPFCEGRGETPDTKFRLGVNILSGQAHCFNCEWKSGSGLQDVADALLLGPVFDGEVKEEPKLDAKPCRLPYEYVPLYDAPKGDLWQVARDYLTARGVTQEQINRKAIGVCLTGWYAYRIVFPIYRKGNLLAFVCRDFTGKQEPKYLNSTGPRPLYNFPRIPCQGETVILCEGIFDCLAIERIVEPARVDVIAVLGHTITEENEKRLQQRYSRIILWADNDKPGIEGFLQLARRFGKWAHAGVFWIPLQETSKDASAMNGKERFETIKKMDLFSSKLEMQIQMQYAFGED